MGDVRHPNPRFNGDVFVVATGGYEEICQISLFGIILDLIKFADYLFAPDKVNEWSGLSRSS